MDRRFGHIVLCIYTLLCGMAIQCMAGEWATHFSYNNVTSIAVCPEETYALANGVLFSVNKTTEALTKYDSRSGLHGGEIACVSYDEARNQLLIIYADGKIDVLKNGRMHYVSDLYNKRMTSSKYCNNVTIQDSVAYLSMEFGILVFNLQRYEFPDTYYIAPEAQEVRVLDVMVYGDSIYAQTVIGNYCANLKDNIVDFRFWNRCTTLPIPFDTKKGKEYTDAHGDIWKSAGEKGVYRHSIDGETVYYLPDGPQVNTPYRLTTDRGRIFAVPGGRWSTQYDNAGHVMIYENGEWTNIRQSTIQTHTGKPARDFVNVAVNPNDKDHFFVTSYGTGLYEFRGTDIIHHYTTSNSIIGAAAPSNPNYYTRTDCAVFDSDGRLWLIVAGGVDTTLVSIFADKSQRGLNIYQEDKTQLYLHTPGGLMIDNQNHHRKWLLSCRSNPAIILLDDNGTPFDSNDDKTAIRLELYDQDNQVIVPENFYGMLQAPNGDVWIGSDKGPIIIDAKQDLLAYNQCRRLRIGMPDSTYLLESERVNAFAFDEHNQIWIGTQSAGVYVLNESATEIVAHYTMDNSPMPSNGVVSLAYEEQNKTMFIGTGSGLVSYKTGTDTGTDIIDTSEDAWTYGNMRQWRAHFAYLGIDELIEMGDKVYALSCNSLFSVDKQTEEIEYYSQLTGLNGSKIAHICYNTLLNKMLVAYQDGKLDIIDSRGEISNISDLYMKQSSMSMYVNDICMHRQYAYLAMNFGIVVVDMRKAEVKETYYIGKDAKEVNVVYLAIEDDNIYAIGGNTLYKANIQDNVIDYANWYRYTLPNTQSIQGMRVHANQLCVVLGGTLWTLKNGIWRKKQVPFTLTGLCESGDRLFGIINTDGVVEIQDDLSATKVIPRYRISAISAGTGYYWLGTEENGVVRVKDSDYQEFSPDGPISNSSYRLRCFGDRLYVLAGGRWASQNSNPGIIMYYENGHWTNINNKQLVAGAKHIVYDVMNVAQDPNDTEHYYITTYGTGMLEMYGDSVMKLYLPSNSGLQAVIKDSPDRYTRTDGAIFDDLGNLWVLNAGLSDKSISVMTRSGEWHTLGTGYTPLHTPGEIMIDKRNPQWKWIPLCRSNTGLVLLQDNGTPTNPADDKVTYRNEWIDQQGKQVLPNNIYSIAQDKDNDIWVGTSAGVFIIPASVDFATSNACERVIIPRNDGTDLGDYLLAYEQINCIVVDGVNRKWIGTATSGIFLMSADGQETIAHFTSDNSLLPDDNILSIAIQESTGEVFIGTSSGLVSYMSDAVEPSENFDDLYAYPNPVRPTYKGYITIKGLMDNSEVRITDASGNLVKLLQGNGGEAVWDGTNTVGKRVASGVYTAICNTTDGQGHGTVKILIMN